MEDLIAESNCIDIYKKLSNNEDVDPEELEEVKEHFNKLVNYKV